MLRILIVGTLLVAAGLVAVPGAVAAPEDPQCHGVHQCDFLIATIKETVERLDPRDWPCTCDPQPEPW